MRSTGNLSAFMLIIKWNTIENIVASIFVVKQVGKLLPYSYQITQPMNFDIGSNFVQLIFTSMLEFKSNTMLFLTFSPNFYFQFKMEYPSYCKS